MGSFFFALSAAEHDPSNNAAAKRTKACTKVTVFTERFKDIACIAHKFLEILERRSQADTSLHRSQIFRDLRSMQAVAAEFSGCAVKFRCCFLKEEFNQFVWISVFQKQLLN